MTTPIGILHPGEMGVSIAASARNGGHSLYWASAGRGPKTRERAEQVGLQDAGTLAALCCMCQAIVSVCPPHAAEEVAEQVLAQGFAGLYLDANAISPQRAARIGERMAAAGASFVDGGIIGGPAWQPGSTRLYLSGPAAAEAAALFAAGPLETVVIGDEIGKASALKMCYAAYSKGSTALLCAVVAAAEQLGVREELDRQWAHDDPRSPDQNANRVRRVTAKAWRFAGEMDEIAATFSAAGLPGEFHAAAATLYRRLAGFKDAVAMPALHEVLAALLQEDKAAT
ncbi:MAG: DUF1932 domain-containing protein [Anaerolineae bacterium]|nr:DUF1932 domain-containing protein [Anaerolineae bacterium]